MTRHWRTGFAKPVRSRWVRPATRPLPRRRTHGTLIVVKSRNNLSVEAGSTPESPVCWCAVTRWYVGDGLRVLWERLTCQ
jgi:hypothetical protein